MTKIISIEKKSFIKIDKIITEHNTKITCLILKKKIFPFWLILQYVVFHVYNLISTCNKILQIYEISRKKYYFWFVFCD